MSPSPFTFQVPRSVDTQGGGAGIQRSGTHYLITQELKEILLVDSLKSNCSNQIPVPFWSDGWNYYYHLSPYYYSLMVETTLGHFHRHLYDYSDRVQGLTPPTELNWTVLF